ncbi:ABC transporter ATP-binding protein [Tateyamaria omphalii]|uniref:ABC transporter ATP-binding protein n=1 Tax=Tateyamaria omphalii TaxID=299262 RepID=A0A1P8MRG5_9RHOB|nr:ABC transporter ATP-binding protein [Tateyamaria omphalii]APX10676.1 ABC transporter ATP-binding protein [Tateyamaria omphalii]
MTEPLLDIRGLSKSFGALRATDDVSLTLLPGEIHALIGPNGAGKSTLIQQIAGGLAPDAGRVMVNGRDVTDLGTADRAKCGLGRTFQISALAMENTVLQNAMLGAVGATRSVWRFLKPVMQDTHLCAEAKAAIERVGLQDVAHARVGTLSHGQRRLLEVAVALTLNPKLFLMDEPMAGLGAEGTARMTSFLNDLRREAPILLVEHDMDAVFTLADRISVLVAGKVIATGTPDEIRSNPDVRTAYLGDEVPL